MNEKIRADAAEWYEREFGSKMRNGFAATIALACWQAAHARYAGSESEAEGWLFQHEDTGNETFVTNQQVEWGFEKNNPRWQKICQLYRRPAPAVPEAKLIALLDRVQDALQDAYQNAGLVCCGKSMMDCCGSPVADWSEADQKIMDVLSPIQRELSAMLTQATKESDK